MGHTETQAGASTEKTADATNMRPYELMVVIDPDIDDRSVEPSLQKSLSVISNDGGTIDKVDIWGRRRSSIEKKSEGTYAVVKFTAKPETAKELDRQLSLDEIILRASFTNPDQPLQRSTTSDKQREDDLSTDSFSSIVGAAWDQAPLTSTGVTDSPFIRDLPSAGMSAALAAIVPELPQRIAMAATANVAIPKLPRDNFPPKLRELNRATVLACAANYEPTLSHFASTELHGTLFIFERLEKFGFDSSEFDILRGVALLNQSTAETARQHGTDEERVEKVLRKAYRSLGVETPEAVVSAVSWLAALEIEVLARSERVRREEELLLPPKSGHERAESDGPDSQTRVQDETHSSGTPDQPRHRRR